MQKRKTISKPYDKPIEIGGTNIRVVRPFNGNNISTILFDLDGTISLERDGWLNIMVKQNSKSIGDAFEIYPSHATEWVMKDIEATMGQPTYIQMKRLNDYIKENGKISKGVNHYKSDYIQALKALVTRKRRNVISEVNGKDKLRVEGTLDLLELLFNTYEDSIYMASGSDEDAVRDSLDYLECSKYFGDRIKAAGSHSDPTQCAKELVIGRLVKDKGLKPGRLATFGDGKPEIYNTHVMGGICVGILTEDVSEYTNKGHFTLLQKEKRLIDAGAHILVPDFKYAKALVDVVHDYFKQVK